MTSLGRGSVMKRIGMCWLYALAAMVASVILLSADAGTEHKQERCCVQAAHIISRRLGSSSRWHSAFSTWHSELNAIVRAAPGEITGRIFASRSEPPFFPVLPIGLGSTPAEMSIMAILPVL